jgi:hypothetical protein
MREFFSRSHFFSKIVASRYPDVTTLDFLYYVKNQLDATLAVLFISHCKLPVHTVPPRILVESDSTICCMYTVCPPEDGHLRLEICRGT